MNEIEKFPRSAYSFYIQLYCKRRSERAKFNTTMEATRSWVSLKNSEKQFIIKKYNEYMNERKKNVAMYLKNAEPYLKLKAHNNNRTRFQRNEDNEEIGNAESDPGPSDAPPSGGEEVETEPGGGERAPAAAESAAPVVAPREPTAPQVTTGRELFEMMKERQGGAEQWERLSRPQKDRYQRAVLAIKRNYLKEYTAYLERLSPRALRRLHRAALDACWQRAGSN